MKVAIVSGVCTPFDAVSDALRQNALSLMSRGDEVTVFSYRCDYDDLPHVDLGDPVAVAEHPDFRDADVHIFHFAIYYSLFGAVLLTPRRSKTIVIYHNLTPKKLLPSWKHEEVDRSFKQLSLFSFVDHVLCVSAFNLATLRDHGVVTPASVQNLGIELPLSLTSSKPSFRDGTLRIMFIGRFVRSKGPQDLLAALKMAVPKMTQESIEVTLVGNPAFSDPNLLPVLRREIEGLEAESRRISVQIVGDADDTKKFQLLQAADLFVLPTYHEGFCVPIVEAMAYGCRVLSYENSNLPAITGGLGQLVTTGDVAALSQGLVDEAAEVGGLDWQLLGYPEYLQRVSEHVKQFDSVKTNTDFTRSVDQILSTP
jgi:glycosyltransferase involved in cell wall biosynthesis